MKEVKYRGAIVTCTGVMAIPIVVPFLEKIESGISLNLKLNQLGIPIEWIAVGLLGVTIASYIKEKEKC